MFGVQKKVIYLVIFLQYNASHTYMFMENRYNARMDQNAELPNNLDACHTLLRQQLEVIAKFAVDNAQLASVNATQARQLEELTAEQEKLRKLIVRLTQGNVSEKRSLSDATQARLPFEDEAEWQAAKAEAEAEAEEIQTRSTASVAPRRPSDAMNRCPVTFAAKNGSPMFQKSSSSARRMASEPSSATTRPRH